MTDMHKPVPLPDAQTMGLVRERLLAFCFPNAPGTEDQRRAFDQAAQLQYAHDATQMLSFDGEVLPQGLTFFKIGDFQMSFSSGALDYTLTRKSICPAVYSILLRHGLLYRGVEGRC